MVRRASDDLEDIDAAAARFKENLKTAAARLSKEQVKDIAASVEIPLGAGQPALRAALLVASACLFHTRLDGAGLQRPATDVRTGQTYQRNWPFATLRVCLTDIDPIERLSEAWESILAVDYKPVFETALAVIEAPRAQNASFTGFVRSSGYAALAAARALTGGQLDLLGRVFHFILDEARHTGAFYTSTAAAALLAGLAIRQEDVDQDLEYSVVDPACGTGTLLAAAAGRIRDISHQHGILGGRHLIENKLHGYDIDIAATHMAAVTLGLMAPDVAFRKMNIHRFYFGLIDDKTTGNQIARSGSLELMGSEGLGSVAGWPRAARSEQVDTGEDTELDATPRDLVIMNPPFTRADLRHGQLGKLGEDAVKTREKFLFQGTPVNRSHYGGMFLMLAERLCKQNGTMALVLPTTGTQNPSTRDIRQWLLERFHLETVITSHDPTRIFFSENTTINESLFIFRRLNATNQNTSTKFIQLAHNPTTAVEAVLLADGIQKNRLSKNQYQIINWPRERVRADDWTPVRFLSPHLTETVYDWFGARKLGLISVGLIAEVGPASGAIRGSCSPRSLADEDGRPAVWYNSQDDPAPNGAPPKQTLRVVPDSYLHPKPGRTKDLDRLWSQRGRLLLPDRFSTTSIRLFGAVSDVATFGSGWIPIKHRDRKPSWEEAMAVYLNSTVGILATLYRVNPKKLVYPNMSLDGMRNIPVPKLDDHQIAALADHYHRIANIPLLRLRDQANDTVRASLDEVVCLTMVWDQEAVRKARFVLSEEPSITGRPAGDPGSRQSRPGKGRRSRSRPHPALFQD